MADRSPTPLPKDFASFWHEFRRAVLASAWADVAQLTCFPVQVKGILDDDPVRQADRKKLGPLLEKVLTQDSGTSEQSQKLVRQLSQQIEPPADAVDDHFARVLDFVFERTNEHWCFASTFLDADTDF